MNVKETFLCILMQNLKCVFGAFSLIVLFYISLLSVYNSVLLHRVPTLVENKKNSTFFPTRVGKPSHLRRWVFIRSQLLFFRPCNRRCHWMRQLLSCYLNHEVKHGLRATAFCANSNDAVAFTYRNQVTDAATEPSTEEPSLDACWKPLPLPTYSDFHFSVTSKLLFFQFLF